MNKLIIVLPAALILCASCSNSKQDPSESSSTAPMVPNSGEGARGRFVFHFPMETGDGLDFAQVLFGNADPTSSPFCFIHYDVSRNEIKLYRGPGTVDFSPGAAPGAPGSIQSDYCSVETASSAVSRAGNVLSLSVSVVFQPSLAGQRTVYSRTLTKSGQDSGWKGAGAWKVPAQ